MQNNMPNRHGQLALNCRTTCKQLLNSMQVTVKQERRQKHEHNYAAATCAAATCAATHLASSEVGFIKEHSGSFLDAPHTYHVFEKLVPVLTGVVIGEVRHLHHKAPSSINQHQQQSVDSSQTS
ncbi:MAG: hypothetical protein MJA30_27670 [Cytophagales bacterium]|nr:hypothetical protein [Cytophagales bacterium]